MTGIGERPRSLGGDSGAAQVDTREGIRAHGSTGVQP